MRARPLYGLLWAAAALLLLSCGGGGGDSTGSMVTPLSISTTTLPGGEVGLAYGQTLAASGGTMPYSWAVTSGTLPAGLSLAAAGAISGTPTTAVAGAAVTFTVTDSGSPAQTKTASLTMTIAAPIAITTTSLPNGIVGTAYSATLMASGGTTPYTWSATLPAGLTLNISSGAISGTPTAATSVPITFTVSDSNKKSVSTTLALTIAPVFSVATTSLPNGQIGHPYSATLTVSGGTAPITWSLTSGSLPAGLALNANMISGTPTATANQAQLTFQAVDSSNPAQNASASLTLNVSPAVISVSVTPARAALAVTQTLTLSASTDDNAGVAWSISPSGGAFNPTSTLTGANATFTAPTSAGAYTITATSLTDATQSASLAVGVTDLAGMYTWHNDLARDGLNAQEYALTTSNVNTTSFGKLFSCSVDGAVYAQPLWVANLTVNGAVHNVVYVATEHDSLFAFDADANANPCIPLWSVSLIDTNHGGNVGGTDVGETSVPSGTSGNLVGTGEGDVAPETGVTGTPVIDSSSGTLYVVSKSVNAAHTMFYQRLHAINLTTGAEKSGSPVEITKSITFPGSGDGGSTVAFNEQEENQRASLALVNGTVYISWGSHEDDNPFYGWIVGYSYNGSAFTLGPVLNVSPNAQWSAIWMSGAAPAADSNNNLYLITGNGLFDVNSNGKDYGDSLLQLSSSLGVSQYFTPSDQTSGEPGSDMDFGSGGAMLLPDLPVNGNNPTHLAVGGGKDGNLYILNRDQLGGLGDGNAWQEIGLSSGSFAGAIFSTAAFWNNNLYIGSVALPLASYQLNPASAKFSANPTSATSAAFKFPGTTPSVSATGTKNGILWALDTSQPCVGKAPACGPAVLHAFDATNLATELWNSSLTGTDTAGYAVKFTVPTVANGKVYVGTRGNNIGNVDTSTNNPGELNVYGLKPN